MMTDTELLDALQKLNDECMYTGKCILRVSDTERGWRLHETSGNGAQNSVRDAIENFIKGR
ncbi:hypothetical protein LCGC14_2926720 [marine sediment metagenome]|uniref:Uncharacterized protein n=1 Tax=marine sediment metagenome TaxID=412755 RepID=A0A0F8ZUW3_9ZZZZ